jgi:hypothetical protein
VSGITPNASTIFDGQKLSALHKFRSYSAEAPESWGRQPIDAPNEGSTLALAQGGSTPVLFGQRSNVGVNYGGFNRERTSRG